MSLRGFICKPIVRFVGNVLEIPQGRKKCKIRYEPKRVPGIEYKWGLTYEGIFWNRWLIIEAVLGHTMGIVWICMKFCTWRYKNHRLLQKSPNIKNTLCAQHFILYSKANISVIMGYFCVVWCYSVGPNTNNCKRSRTFGFIPDDQKTDHFPTSGFFFKS